MAIGIRNFFRIKSATPPLISPEIFIFVETVQPIHIIKEFKLPLPAKIPRHTKQPIRLKPEIIRGKIINRRIDQ